MRRIFVWAIFAFACTILLFFATYHLSEAPHIWYDEGYFTQTAQNLALYGRQAIQVAPGEFASASTVTGGYPLIAPVALSYKLFGVGVLQGRSVMVVFIVAFFLAAVYLINLLFGTRFALWGAFLIASFPMLYGVGKNVLGEVPGLFFLLLTLIAFVYLQRTGYRSLLAYAASAGAAGLCVVTKPIFILLLPAIALVWFLYRKSIPVRLGGVILAIFVFIVALAPWFLLQFGTHDSLANVLSFYANPYEVTNVTSLVLTNLLLFVTDVTPLYTLAVFALWGGSLILRRRSGESVSPAESVGFVFTALIMLAFLRLPGWYRYLFPAIMIGLPFLPYALWRLWEWMRPYIRVPRIAPFLPWFMLLLLIVAQIYQTMNSSFVATYYRSHTTRDVTSMLGSLPKSASVFVYNVPEAVILLPSRNYYQYIEAHEHSQVGVDALSTLERGVPDYVVVDTTLFAQKPEIFARYKQIENAGRYLVLNRK